MTAILDRLKRDRISQLLAEGTRIDGRGFDQMRELKIETGIIPKADGSARVRLGDSDVICGIKIQPDRPFPDVGDKGIFICTAELLPFSHPTVETGPPNEAVIELARVVDRGVRESKMVDLSQLVIKKDKSVIGVFADNTVLDYDGNLFDACSYATTAAVLSAKCPRWEMKDDVPTMTDDEKAALPISTIPVSITMGRIGDHIIVDPSGEEWDCLDARITITSDSDGNICALQKGGKDGFTVDELVQCGQTAVGLAGKIRDILGKVRDG